MENQQHQQDRSLFVNIKMPPDIKRRLDEITIGDNSAFTKTGLVRTLLQRYFKAVDENRSNISILMS